MGKIINKNSNIILRLTKEEHDCIKLRAKLCSKNKSEFIRESAICSPMNEKDATFKDIVCSYKSSNQEDKDNIIQLIFKYYRHIGFPYADFTEEMKIDRLNRIRKSKSPLLDNNELQANTVGLDLANYFHPQMMKAYYNYTTETNPWDAFYNDDKLKDAIKKWLDMGNAPTKNGIRRILRTRNGIKSVTNFKPVIAKFIYDTYAVTNSNILDPCCGYSGRLLGALASSVPFKYHGIDPDCEAIKGNLDCYNSLNTANNYEFYLACAEDIMPTLNKKFSLIFTSPPYYDLEIYSNNKTQSSNRYSTYQEWLNKFLFIIIKESYRLLEDNGKMVVNIKNTKRYKIADDMVGFCESIGFNLIKEYKMRLINREFNRGNDNFHYEPVHVFSKSKRQE
jgi:16S rRNA G966 N2-methylase RsmD